MEIEPPGSGPYLGMGYTYVSGREAWTESRFVGLRLTPDPTGVEPLPRGAMARQRTMGSVGDFFDVLPRFGIAPEIRGNPLGVLYDGPIPVAATEIPAPPRPPGGAAESHPGDYFLNVSNDVMAVVTPFGPPAARFEFAVYDKAKKAWQMLPVPTASIFVRAYGPWLAIEGSTPVEGTRVRLPDGTILRSRGGEYPGNAEKRREQTIGFRMTVQGRLELSGFAHVGEWLLVNVKTGARADLHTGEADSEVLLVTGDRVVYRINDSMYVGRIANGQVVDGTRLATGPEVVGVHWVFESSASAGQAK